MIYAKAFLVWWILAGLAVSNRIVRTFWITPVVGEMPGHWIGTLTGGMVIFLGLYLLLPWLRPETSRQHWEIGIFSHLDRAFEFLAGHYLFGTRTATAPLPKNLCIFKKNLTEQEETIKRVV